MGRQIYEAIVDGILGGGVYGLMAVGLTLIFGVLDIINIAQGILVILGAYLSYVLSVHLHIDLFLGLLVTVPARTVTEGLARVEALAAPLGAGVTSVAPLVASTIDLAIHVVANADGSARIVDIVEPKVDASRTAADAVIAWRSDGGRRGAGAGKLTVTGVSARLAAALAAVGQSLPSNLVRR